MSDPTSAWGLSDTDFSTIAFQDGALRIQIHADTGAAYSQHGVGGEYAVLLAGAEFIPTDSGAFGLLCSSAEGVYYGATVTTDGALIFFSVEGGQVEVLERINDVGIDFPANEPTTLGVECAGMATGAVRLVAVLSGAGPIGVHQLDEGPQTFNGVTLYGEGFQAEFAVDIEQVAAYGIAGSATGMTPEAEELLTHVPELFQETCTESPVAEDAEAILHCYLQTDGVGAELLQYASFANNSDMEVAYQEAVEQFGVPSEGSCQSGPNETTWSIGDDEFGRLQCAPQQVGIRIDWTDERLAILSTLIDFDGDYAATYDAWLEAGPEV